MNREIININVSGHRLLLREELAEDYLLFNPSNSSAIKVSTQELLTLLDLNEGKDTMNYPFHDEVVEKINMLL